MIKLAIVSPLNYATTMQAVGSVESLVAHLIHHLNKEQYHVTLFASGDSTNECDVIPIISHGLGKYAHDDITTSTQIQVEQVKSMASQFDLIHSHLPVEDTFKMLGGHHTPILKTVHGAIVKPHDSLATQRRLEVASHIPYLTPISKAMGKESPLLNYTDVVYNGVPMDKCTFIAEPKGDDKGEYWAFMGRITPIKGIHYAVQAAIKCHKRLKIAGAIATETDKKYFDTAIKPYLGDLIEYVGVLKENKYDFLGNATLVFTPTCYAEAFGLVTVEALACGTPVITTNRGAFPEIIKHGKNGYLVDSHKDTLNESQLLGYIDKAYHLDRSACRQSVVSGFTCEKMTKGYETVYRKILNK